MWYALPEKTIQNQVRERAGFPPLEGLCQAEFREVIRDKRAVELGFEDHRNFDLLRWDFFVEAIKNVDDKHLEIPSEHIQRPYIYMPVPSREIEVSQGSLVQDPGY